MLKKVTYILIRGGLMKSDAILLKRMIRVLTNIEKETMVVKKKIENLERALKPK